MVDGNKQEVDLHVWYGLCGHVHVSPDLLSQKFILFPIIINRFSKLTLKYIVRFMK